MKKQFEPGTPAYRDRMAYLSAQKALYLERMDELLAVPVHSFTVYDSPHGYYCFCTEFLPMACFSTGSVDGETAIGLFSSSFITACRDGLASNYSPINTKP